MPDRPVAVRLTIAVDGAADTRCGVSCAGLREASGYCELFQGEDDNYLEQLPDGDYLRCQPCLDAEIEARDGE